MKTVIDITKLSNRDLVNIFEGYAENAASEEYSVTQDGKKNLPEYRNEIIRRLDLLDDVCS